MPEELKDSKLIAKLNLVDIEKISSSENYSFKEDSWDRAIAANLNWINKKALTQAEKLNVKYYRIKETESRLDYDTNFFGCRKRRTERIVSTSLVQFYNSLTI